MTFLWNLGVGDGESPGTGEPSVPGEVHSNQEKVSFQLLDRLWILSWSLREMDSARRVSRTDGLVVPKGIFIASLCPAGPASPSG